MIAALCSITALVAWKRKLVIIKEKHHWKPCILIPHTAYTLFIRRTREENTEDKKNMKSI